jgi:biopolymer transport protein ExbD
MAGGASEENPVAINVVAMVDIIFCLCLFFMCSLKFQPLDAKFESWLPKDIGPSGGRVTVLDEIRVRMSWNAQANTLERLFGQQPVPPTAAGTEELGRLIRDSYAAFKSRGQSDVPLILDAGSQVPWKHVVEVLDLGRDAGVPRLEFAFGTPLTR